MMPAGIVKKNEDKQEGETKKGQGRSVVPFVAQEVEEEKVCRQ